jgi:hypothetical protein
MKWLQILLKRRKHRQNISAFKSILDDAPITGSFKTPAGGRFVIKNAGGAPAGTISVVISGGLVPMTIPIGDAPTITLDWISANHTVTPASGFEIYLDTGLNNLVLIAKG